MSEVDFKLKQTAYEYFLGCNNKTHTAHHFGVSPRTIGRWISDVERAMDSLYEESHEEPDDAVKADLDAGGFEEDTVVKNYTYFVVSDGNLINVTRVAIDGSEPPHSEICHKSSDHYEKALSLYQQGDMEGVFLAISNKHRIEKLSNGKVTCYPEQNALVYEDGPNRFNFSSGLTSRVIDTINKGGDATGLMLFANKLSKNPSPRAVEELHDFLQAMDIAITEEGMVRCYKKVRANYTDCHTGKYDNSVGVAVEMPRHMVNDDSRITCSHGLHVCSKAYLSHFGGERVLAVDVDPADFVSIPHDYYSVDEHNTVKAKARVCKYVVVADITDEV